MTKAMMIGTCALAMFLPGEARCGSVVLTDIFGASFYKEVYDDSLISVTTLSDSGQTRDAEYDSDGSLFIVSPSGGRIYKNNQPFTAGGTASFGMTIAPGGEIFAGNGTQGEIRRYDPNTGQDLGVFTSLPGSFFFEMSYGPDGNFYAIERQSESLLRFDGNTGALIDTVVSGLGIINVNTNAQTYFRFGPDGMIYLPATNRIHVIDPSTKGIVDTFGLGQMQNVSDLAFRSDGMIYITEFTGSQQQVLRYDADTLTFIDVFAQSPSGNIARSIASPDEYSVGNTIIPSPLSFFAGSAGLLWLGFRRRSLRHA